MPAAPWFTLQVQDGRTTLRLAGAWRLPRLAEIEAALDGLALPAIERNLSNAAATDN
jgi:hypothetical protein